MIYAVILLIAAALMLILNLINTNRKISEIARSLDKISGGNYNLRVKVQNHNKNLAGMIISVNKLADELQEVIDENHKYEDDRKTMVANISHDLRTPMTSLLGYIEMLRADNQLTPEEKARYLDIIQSKGTFLYELMEDFFQLSKLDFEEVDYDAGKVNISEVIRQNMASFYNDFRKLDIEPSIKMPDEDVYVTGNEADLQRVLNNLVWNALKYGSDGGHIGVELRNEGSRAVIDVWDNGKGIPEHELPHVFERLYTLEKSRNAKFQGSGLGLTIAKKLIEKYNGSIEVKSVPYEKTVFSFSMAKCSRTINA